MKAKLLGAKEMVNTIKKIAQKFPDRCAAALYQEAQIEMTESKRRCPVDVTSGRGGGTLRASGHVQRPVRSGRKISVTLAYGGAAEDYAIIQHEELDYHHEVGQAKYLESVLNESAPHMAARVARRLSTAP